MPDIIFRYDPKVIKLTPEEWTKLGSELAVPLAKLMSTNNHRLSPSTDIDFDPIAYQEGYIGLTAAIRIETIGYPERKAKVTKALTQVLKDEFIFILKENGINFDPKKSLIWIKYQDPDGHHI